MSNENMNLMGVINITPNSFSDANKNFNLESIKSNVLHQFKWAKIIDFGCESTAPFNEPILEEIELQRFMDLLIPALSDLKAYCGEKVFSIDTYRPKVFKSVFLKLNALFPNAKIIWNDISGVLDEETIATLQETNCDYVLNFTNVLRKERSNYHQNEIKDYSHTEFLNELNLFFKRNLNLLNEKNYQGNIFLDPGLGFSKTREQNIFLLKNMNLVLNFYKNHNWLIGMSRKSFLRPIQTDENKFLSTDDLIAHTECMQSIILKYWSERFQVLENKNLYFRTHNNISFTAFNLFSNFQ